MIDSFLTALSLLDRVLGVVERVIIGGCILVMALLMSGHVVGQTLFEAGIPGTYEVTKMLIVVLTFVGLGYAARHARHIRMSAFYEQLNGPARKALQMIICAGTAALMLYFAWKSAQYVIDIHDRGRVSASLQVPMWTVYLALPIGFTLAGAQYLLTLARNALSPGVWRSFSEEENYAQVPAEAGVSEDGEGRQ
ncbi:TRAP-C4-dicarboxylate transport system, small permease [Alcanivorax hongdengensis A-11-3]|uniref:TRAP transporter small permease protein n=1 Tax=Alcanivorax hongdengensis A-11-3 TaxID=1177179 RepID=L0WGP4_9GAMM|nr:TRAP transporter small permease [Alcanivorax hongdengensis]EKF75874.1 TRAP-C4-dicarboxylate transport system, small permease [Alcanivorax hongdengensis A-11-3]